MNNSISTQKMNKSPLLTNLSNSNYFHIKNKPSLPNQTTVSMISKSNLRTMNKTTPNKQLNKKIIDSLNITANDTKYNKTYQSITLTHNNKQRLATEETAVLNQELKSSNNIIFSLNNIISSLTNRVDQMEADNISLTEYYKKGISALQSENEEIRAKINAMTDEKYSDITAELEALTDEEKRLELLLREKEEESKSFEEQLYSVSINLKKQKEDLVSNNSYYTSIIRRKEQQIDYLSEISKGSLIVFTSKKYLFPRSKLTGITSLLRIQLSFILPKQSKEELINYLLEDNNNSRLTCSDIAHRLLHKINKENMFDEGLIQAYVETLLLQEDQFYIDIEHIKERLSVLFENIIPYSENDHQKYSESLISILKSNQKRLEELLHSKDKQKKGTISYEVFIYILKKMEVKLTDDLHYYALYIMKSNSYKPLAMFELNYLNLLFLLNPKPRKKVDNYISRIRGYLNQEQTSIRDFLGSLTEKIQMISNQSYIENDIMNEYLKKKGILADNEELDKDNTPELINVDFLANLFEQEAKTQTEELVNNNTNRHDNENEDFNSNENLVASLSHKLANEILALALNDINEEDNDDKAE